MRAFSGKKLGGGKADSAGAARNDRNLPSNRFVIVVLIELTGAPDLIRPSSCRPAMQWQGSLEARGDGDTVPGSG